MKRETNQMFVKVEVVAENEGICTSLLKFRDSRISKFKIKECNQIEKSVKVNVDFIVSGDYERCIRVIRRLNHFLTGEDLNYKYGYCEIKTTPAEYEVV